MRFVTGRGQGAATMKLRSALKFSKTFTAYPAAVHKGVDFAAVLGPLVEGIRTRPRRRYGGGERAGLDQLDHHPLFRHPRHFHPIFDHLARPIQAQPAPSYVMVTTPRLGWYANYCLTAEIES